MKKVKHDHKGTKLLKLGIFASLMLAPLLAIAFKCAYVTFNKNAYQSYSGEVKTTNTELATKIESNLDYELTYAVYTGGMTSSAPIEVSYIKAETNYSSATTWFNTNTEYIKYFMYYQPSGGSYQVRFYDENMNSLGYWLTNYNNSYWKISFTASNNVNLINNDIIYQVNTSTSNTLDNAFYYAIDEMKNNELFNWTTNTVIYTPTSAMTNGMGITTTALPILITYWLYLTAIYIVVDIVIELFTYLTHMITSRLDT